MDWDYDHDQLNFGGQEHRVNRSVKYRHTGNDCWYHPTDKGSWVPAFGQGMEMYPRSLNETYLEGYKVTLPFKKGDIVRLKTGSAPIRVEVAKSRYLTGEYTSSGTRVVARKTDDFVLHEDYNNVNMEKENTMTNTNTLYEITLTDANTVTYGHYLATNSSGQWVMEEKGTGKIHTVDKSSVQEVLPHTIGVQFLDGGVGNVYNYFAEKGKFSIGDMFVLSNALVVVTAIDTKSKMATKDFTPTVKVLTEKV